jgi:hypothetical protein
MSKIYTFFILSFLLLSCTPAKLSYIGSKQNPTQKVDVYVDESAIKRSYVIIGKGYLQPNWQGKIDQEKMLALAIAKAKRNGADAIFYRESFIQSPSSTLSTVSVTDTIASGVYNQTKGTITQSLGYVRTDVLFLQYR